MKTLAILGAGSWGTALAIALESRFERVNLWVRDPELAAEIQAVRENRKYLSDFVLSPRISIFDNIQESVEKADLVLGVMPSAYCRQVFSEAVPAIRFSTPVVSATKGIERGTLLRMSAVISEVVPNSPVCVLSGPTFAREIASGEPAAVVVASQDRDLAAFVQQHCSTQRFRLYTNADVIGVEIGAALKNVIAIGAGIAEGLGLGSNTKAALITRGLAEISRLAIALGGEPRTLAGLAGLGDLVLTCTGSLSRNRRVGLELASGKPLADILKSMHMVAEGIETTASALALAKQTGVDLPIAAAVDSVLKGDKKPLEAVRELMERSLKGE